MRLRNMLLVDALICLVLGALLASFPTKIVDLLGVPRTETAFYPSILGAVLIGIAAALVIEYVRKPTGADGLGFGGAIAIDLLAAIFLIGWLLAGNLDIPLRGRVLLWGLAAVLVLISLAELAFHRERA